MELIVNDKRVVFRDKIPAKIGWQVLVNHSDMFGKALTDINFDDIVALLIIAIESWEFEGLPSEPASYENLDLVLEVMPMAVALGNWLKEHFATPKN